MQYSKPMIDLVYEIRRRVDPATKPGVKLANPDMPQELADYYLRSQDVVTKALVKELFFLAGNEWIELIEGKAEPLPKQTVKAYRGQVSLVDSPVSSAPATTPKPLRIYRGQIVDY